MARRGLTGQLNMFDFFRELETNIPQDGELEMVSLMPDFEKEPDVEPDKIPVTTVEQELVTESIVEKEAETRIEVTPPIIMENETENQPSESNKEIKNTNKKKTKKKSELSEVEETPLPSLSLDNSNQRPVMQRTYSTKQGTVEIAYINYSKVRMCEPGKEPQITEFASSKEAVDFYVEQMQKLEELYGEA